MKLTVEEVAKRTGLTESTVRQYARQKKLGKLEGRSKVFTLAEAKKLGGLKDGSKKVKRAKRPAAARPKARRSPKREARVAVRKEPPKAEAKLPSNEKKSFWSFLGIGGKPKTKVSLMDVKGRR